MRASSVECECTETSVSAPVVNCVKNVYLQASLASGYYYGLSVHYVDGVCHRFCGQWKGTGCRNFNTVTDSAMLWIWACHVSIAAKNHLALKRRTQKPCHVPLPVRSFKARWLLRSCNSHSFRLQLAPISCTAARGRLTSSSIALESLHQLVVVHQLVVMNAPLPTYDMMTGQQVAAAQPVSANAAATLANDADVVHVQLLDRMIVVPRAVVNVSLVLSSSVPSPAKGR